ncbi:MAG: patatin-like phospholipase family protein [Alicyclobacillaceae bacterium]|uniref:patatin-like phospholipase family protein n=1 Tax=Alicyclobacillus sp. SP_1 TaxID=2942475 RepID=UPI0021585591|nr:patatin-like phospholipase family protein [Alicyclobacillus sp. SP_1]MCY0886911.1 patatin-like phospholipase family protein [Alicyclobacillaceae bacterium]MCY0895888.1 patatin-like phospholipase family protein [Alicyclobacillaceae bacterium]
MTTIGLALGSGGAKGFAHVGVLRALEEHGVRVGVISGSSMGGLVAAFYATGMQPAFMEQLATTLRRRHWIDFTVPKMGMVSGDRVRTMVALLTRQLAIEQANIPLAIVATDLLNRRKVVFKSGSIADAVRASVSIPGVFVPVVHDGGVLVDGGVLDRVPVEVTRELGADKVIAVDVSTNTLPQPPTSLVDVFFQSLDLMQEQVYAGVRQSADVTIVPDVSAVGISQFGKAKIAIEAGYEAALQKINDIDDMLQTVKTLRNG